MESAHARLVLIRAPRFQQQRCDARSPGHSQRLEGAAAEEAMGGLCGDGGVQFVKRAAHDE